jgi:hypothetical protein
MIDTQQQYINLNIRGEINTSKDNILQIQIL